MQVATEQNSHTFDAQVAETQAASSSFVREDDGSGIAMPTDPLGLRAPVTRDDTATGKLLQSILDIVAECDQTPEFAGFQVSEARNADGLLLYVRLVPCDNVGGIVSPRTV